MKYMLSITKNTKGRITIEACIAFSAVILILSFFLFIKGYVDGVAYVKERTFEKALDISLSKHMTGIYLPITGKVLALNDERKYSIKELFSYVKPESENVIVVTYFEYQGILGDVRSFISSSVPKWDGDGMGKDVSNVWLLPPMERGLEIEKIFGGNLPRYFPLLDVYDSISKKASVIVSIDTTLDSYITGKGITKRIKDLADDFISFEYGEKDGVVIGKEDIKSKRIIVVIPNNPLNRQQLDELEVVKNYCEKNKIEFILKRYQNSGS